MYDRVFVDLCGHRLRNVEEHQKYSEHRTQASDIDQTESNATAKCPSFLGGLFAGASWHVCRHFGHRPDHHLSDYVFCIARRARLRADGHSGSGLLWNSHVSQWNWMDEYGPQMNVFHSMIAGICWHQRLCCLPCSRCATSNSFAKWKTIMAIRSHWIAHYWCSPKPASICTDCLA